MNVYKSVNFFSYHSHLLRTHKISSKSLIGKQIKLQSKGDMILTNAERNEGLDTSHSSVNNMEPQSVANFSSVILPLHSSIPDSRPQSGILILPVISPNCPNSSPNTPPLIFDKGVSSHDNLENQGEEIVHMSGLHESDSLECNEEVSTNIESVKKKLPNTHNMRIAQRMSSSLPTEKILLKNLKIGRCQWTEVVRLQE